MPFRDLKRHGFLPGRQEEAGRKFRGDLKPILDKGLHRTARPHRGIGVRQVLLQGIDPIHLTVAFTELIETGGQDILERLRESSPKTVPAGGSK